MAATRDEFPDFNLLAAFGLEEVENEKDAINAGKNEASSEQNNKKRRFAETNNQDLDDIVKNSQAKQTKKATQWAVSVFTGWLKQYESIFIQHYKRNVIRTKKKTTITTTRGANLQRQAILLKLFNVFHKPNSPVIKRALPHTLRLFVQTKNF